MIRTISALSRTIDLRYESNLFAVITTVTTSLLLGFKALTISFFDPLDLITGSIMVFVCWAIVREIDPDRVRPSYIVSIVAASAIIFYYPFFSFSITLPIIILLCARVITRSTGYGASWQEGLVLVLLALLHAALYHDWLGFVIVGTATLIDYYAPRPYKQMLKFSLLSFFVASLMLILLPEAKYIQNQSLIALIFILFTVMIFELAIQKSCKNILSRCDNTKERINGKRVYLASQFVVLALLFATFRSGGIIINHLPIWLCLLAVSLNYFTANIGINLKPKRSNG